MKTSGFPILFGIALLIFTAIGCKTEYERPQMCTVTSVSGEAQYWDGQSNKVHLVKKGDRIPPGSTIETAKGTYLNLATGERLVNVYLNYTQLFDPADNVRVYENSILKLSKVTLRTVGTNRIPDTRLQLLQGAVSFDVRAIVPAQLSRGEIIAPYHELSGSNVVVHAEHAAFLFTASGITRVILGTATLERTDQGITKELSAWHAYDPITGEISSIQESYHNYYMYFGGRDSFPPERPWMPKFKVPQRPF